MSHFTPWQAPRPCWHCTHFVGLIYDGSAAACVLGTVRSMPENGCAFWQREPGSDDEPDRQPNQPAGQARTITAGRLYSSRSRSTPTEANMMQARCVFAMPDASRTL